MEATKSLHDSGPYDGRLLDELLQAGVLMLDGQQRCCFASARACAHFGASDEAALLAGWDDFRTDLGLPDVTALGVGDPPLQRRSDLPAVGLPSYATVRALGVEPARVFQAGVARCAGAS